MNRAKLNLIWAENGEAVDPDLDVDHPIFQPNKYVKGWIVEKEPHTWQNYLYQITDLKQQVVAESGITEFDQSVVYAVGAVCFYGEQIYLNISGKELQGVTPTDTRFWDQIAAMGADDFNSKVASLEAKIKSHLAADNPHNDNIKDIGGYEKETIVSFFADPTDPRTLPYHMNRTGRVHGETPQQVGTLPDSGGNFTGDVSFNGGLHLAGTAAVRQDGAFPGMGVPKGKIIFSDVARYADTSDASVDSTPIPITTNRNFEQQQANVNNLFALDQPTHVLDFRQGTLSSLNVGGWTVETTNDPVFNYGLVLEDDQLLVGGPVSGTKTILIEYYEGSVFFRKAFRAGSSSWNGFTLKQLVKQFAAKATSLNYLAFYPRQTDYQTLSLLPLYESILIQNDSSSAPGTAWYVEFVEPGVYRMPNATAKGYMYMGAFIRSPDGVRGGRLDSTAVWTTSDASVVSLTNNPTATGQQVFNCLKPGIATMTVTWNGMSSRVLIIVN